MGCHHDNEEPFTTADVMEAMQETFGRCYPRGALEAKFLKWLAAENKQATHDWVYRGAGGVAHRWADGSQDDPMGQER